MRGGLLGEGGEEKKGRSEADSLSESSPQHFHLPACSHPQHCMSTLAAATLAGSHCPRISHVIMHPWSHDSLNYTNRTTGCRGTTVFYAREALNNKILTPSATKRETKKRVHRQTSQSREQDIWSISISSFIFLLVDLKMNLAHQKEPSFGFTSCIHMGKRP